MLLSTTIVTFASDTFQFGDLYYCTFSDSTVGVISDRAIFDRTYDYSELTSVIIPESVTYNDQTYSVTTIYWDAFHGCTNLTSITIPNSITSIGDWAFAGCSSLTSITIPNRVTSIGHSVFSYCSGLTSIIIPDGVTTIENSTFDGCSGLTSITIPDGVTSIGVQAFQYCRGLTSITIPNSVTTIREYAFYGCTGLTSITIPDGVTTIGDDAFYNVANVVYSGTAIGAPWGARSMNGYVDGDLVYSDATKTTLLACYNTATGMITIPNSVMTISEYAFYGCTGLTSITIPNSVTTIGEYAFYGCSGLTSITIPDGVTSIGEFAFGGCTGLTSITIPNSVTTIGDDAFSTNVANIVYSGTAIGAPWGARSVNGYIDGDLVYSDATKTTLLACYNTATGMITIPNSVMTIGEFAFVGCTGITSVTIPNSVTTIEWSAFYGCSGITSVTIPNSVTTIAGCAFYGCSSLTSITIPNSVAYIGRNAFSGTLWYDNQPNGMIYINDILYKYKGTMPQGTNIVVKEGTTCISGSAFDGCTGLTSVTIPNSVTTIGVDAFFSCSSLTSVTIPNSVTTIGDYAFYWTPWYDNQPDGVVYINRVLYAYKGTMPQGTSIVVKEGTISISGCAFYGCNSGLTSVIIPNSVTSIGAQAFEGCSSLTSITIPSSVTSIGNWAFQGCSGLTSVTCYATEPPTVKDYTFKGVNIESIPLYVPAESVKKYKGTVVWKDFMEILPIQSTAIDQPTPDPTYHSAQIRKVFRNGQVLILRGEKTYTVTGEEL